jgi:hypothetical protein
MEDNNMKNIGIGIVAFIIAIILPIELCIACAVYQRTKIANYDVKFAHYHMETKYCPYCGELLEEE